jgi:hypothetical protein
VSGQHLGPSGNVPTRHAPVKGLVNRRKDGQALASARSESGQGVERLGVVERGGVECESGFLGRSRGRSSKVGEDSGQGGGDGNNLPEMQIHASARRARGQLGRPGAQLTVSTSNNSKPLKVPELLPSSNESVLTLASTGLTIFNPSGCPRSAIMTCPSPLGKGNKVSRRVCEDEALMAEESERGTAW